MEITSQEMVWVRKNQYDFDQKIVSAFWDMAHKLALTSLTVENASVIVSAVTEMMSKCAGVPGRY